jgi:hypothetical protein
LDITCGSCPLIQLFLLGTTVPAYELELPVYYILANAGPPNSYN